MASRFRDLKRKARRTLHSHLEVPALYLATPSSDPVPCNVRLWTKWGAIGAMSEGWAEMQEATPRIIFMIDEVPRPRNLAVVSIEAGEAYRIDNTDRPDDITITAHVTRIPAGAELDALPVPE